MLHVRFLLLVPGLLKSAIQVNDVDADDDEITIIIIHLQLILHPGKAVYQRAPCSHTFTTSGNLK